MKKFLTLAAIALTSMMALSMKADNTADVAERVVYSCGPRCGRSCDHCGYWGRPWRHRYYNDGYYGYYGRPYWHHRYYYNE